MLLGYKCNGFFIETSSWLIIDPSQCRTGEALGFLD